MFKKIQNKTMDFIGKDRNVISGTVKSNPLGLKK